MLFLNIHTRNINHALFLADTDDDIKLTELSSTHTMTVTVHFLLNTFSI
jgi:hypothetical protein